MYKPTFYVLDENALGYIYEDSPVPNNFHVMHGSVLRGYSGPPNGESKFVAPYERAERLRLATNLDFENYRVCSDGYDLAG